MTNSLVKVNYFHVVNICFIISVIMMSGFAQMTRNSTVGDNWGMTMVKYVKLNYTWTITDYSLLDLRKNKSVNSPMFSSVTANHVNWFLKIQLSDDEEFLSVFLCLSSNSVSQVKVHTKLCILNDKFEETQTLSYVKVVDKHGWGWPKFIKREFLLDKENQLLPNDQLTFFVQLTAIMGTENLSGQCNMASKKATQSQFIDKLEIFFKNKKLSDVVLISQDTQMQAHKLILSVRSPVFARMFEKGANGLSPSVVQINDVEEDTMFEALRYMYTGKVKDWNNREEKLLSVANMFGIDGLRQMCEEKICKNINADNVLNVFFLADRYKADKLKSRATEYIVAHFHEVIEKPEFKKLMDSYPRYLTNTSSLVAN